jgi:molybdenum cofactor cytidylyltransferase
MDGKRGHPVGFSALYRARLQSLTGDTGAREIVNAEANSVEEIRVDDGGIFFDIDTQADMKL